MTYLGTILISNFIYFFYVVAAWQNFISLVTCSPAYVLREIYLISYLIRRISHIIAASALVSWLLIAKSVPPTPSTSVGKIVDRTAQRKIRLRPYRFLKMLKTCWIVYIPWIKLLTKLEASGVWKQWQDAQQTHPQSICVMKAVARSHDQINSLENWRVCVFSLSPSFLIVVNHLYVDKSTGKRP